MKKALVYTLFSLLLLGLISCEKDDPVIPNEEEVITTLNYVLTSTTDQSMVTFSFQDLDGDGGDTPVVSAGTLDANTTYTGEVTLLNEQESPAENITLEVEEEDDEHQFFYTSSVSGLSIAYADQDADGNPVGIATMLSTGDAGTGTLTIILRHEPNKSGSGVSSGDITNAGGESDIEVTFNVTVQ